MDTTCSPCEEALATARAEGRAEAQTEMAHGFWAQVCEQLALEADDASDRAHKKADRLEACARRRADSDPDYKWPISAQTLLANNRKFAEEQSCLAATYRRWATQDGPTDVYPCAACADKSYWRPEALHRYLEKRLWGMGILLQSWRVERLDYAYNWYLTVMVPCRADSIQFWVQFRPGQDLFCAKTAEEIGDRVLRYYSAFAKALATRDLSPGGAIVI